MTLKRPLLFLLSIVVSVFVGASLFQSLTQPQVQDRLAIAQTYLTLQASELDVPGQESGFLAQTLLGQKPYEAALRQYDPLIDSTQKSLEVIRQQAATEPAPAPEIPIKRPLKRSPEDQSTKQRTLLRELQTEAGLLNVLAGNSAEAQKLWQTVQQRNPDQNPNQNPNQNLNQGQAAAVLSGLWSEPPQLLPEAEPTLKRNLRGWFRDEALAQLYTLEQRQDDLAELETARQARAEQTLSKLAFVVLLPIVSALLGSGIILTLLVKAWRSRGKSLASPLAIARWDVPWDGSWLAIGLLGGFFFVGQIIVSLGLGSVVFTLVNQALGETAIAHPIRAQAIGVFCIYNLMAVGVLGFLYLCLKSFAPLPPDWFQLNPTRGRWALWGMGGYLAAYPLVLLVSLANQQIWDGQGGSNPLLTLALENQDNVALVFFFVTAAIAAPIFEEIFFRGFLMTSLTRFMPGWGAVLLSAFIFASAHLSLSEVLPLMTLGTVLGFVYGRSRNLLASILLHSLWNSGTLVSLFLLGSALRA